MSSVIAPAASPHLRLGWIGRLNLSVTKPVNWELTDMRK